MLTDPWGPQSMPDHARILATVTRARPGAIGGATPGLVMKVNGRAEPGPDGLLTAPFSKQPCVWYRAVMVPLGQGLGYTGTTAPTLAAQFTSDMGLPPADQPRPPTPNLATEPFYVDDGTGRVLVDAARADIDSGVVTVNTHTEHQGDQPHAYWREWIIPAGCPVFVCGTVADGPNGAVLEPNAPDLLVVSTKGEAHVVSRAQAVLTRSTPPVRTGLLVGLTIGAIAFVVVLVVLVFVLRS